MPLWEQLLPLTLCVGGLIVVARLAHVRNRDAGGGWRYIYWQPWRVWTIGLCIAGFVLLYVFIGTVMVFSPLPVPVPQ